MNKEKQSTATGVLVIDKHEGITSHGIVSSLRKLYDMRQIGHTGTLDPMATGVLPVLLGRAVKATEFLIAEDKEYEAEMTLGLTTDTEDITGEVLSRSDDIPDAESVFEVCRAFVGDLLQTPPMYSAVKVGGRKLYDIAREGEEIERAARRVTIASIEPGRVSDRVYKLKIACSKGTYIRTLCADIGRALGCGAVMSALRRTRSGPFTLSDAHTLDELSAMTLEERIRVPMPTEKLFEDFPAVDLGDFYAKLARGGNELYQKKLGTSFETGDTVRLRARGVFIALGRVVDFAGGSAIKPVKLFVL